MSSCQLMFPGVRSSLVFSGFGLKPPASGFQSYFYSSLKTSPSSVLNLVTRWLLQLENSIHYSRGRRAASMSCKSCASPSPRVQSASTLAQLQAGCPLLPCSRLPHPLGPTPCQESGQAPSWELTSLPVPGTSPPSRPPSSLPAGKSQRERAGGASARRGSR